MNRTDLLVLFSVENANPNGDPMEENRPRTTPDNKGLITDVCIKRKIRNRLAEMGYAILDKSTEDCRDEENTTYDRVIECLKSQGFSEKDIKGKKKPIALSFDKIDVLQKQFIDVRAFGQVYTDENARHTTGAASVSLAMSYDPIDIVSTQITKSYSLDDKEKKDRSTMGMKHFVRYGLYSVYININGLLAEQYEMTDKDVEDIVTAVGSMFLNDASTARPAGSINIEKMVVVKHNSQNGKWSPKKVKEILHVKKKENVTFPTSYADYNVSVDDNIVGAEVIVFDEPWFDGEELICQ